MTLGFGRKVMNSCIVFYNSQALESSFSFTRFPGRKWMISPKYPLSFQKLVRVVLLITIISQYQIVKLPTPLILRVYMSGNLKAVLTVFFCVSCS